MNFLPEERGRQGAATLLRVSLGTMYLAHSVVLKLATFGLSATVGYFTSLGLPPVTAYLVVIAEMTGGALLIANIATRWVALALIPILLGATWVHAANGWVFNANGGGWEYPAFLIVVSLVVAAHSADHRYLRSAQS
jgi:putative oxidoreductase